MATLFNTKISQTYPGLLKTIDNVALSATLRELTDGSGNLSGLFLNTAGDFKVTNILEWGSLKDTGTGVTITQFVTQANGIANFDNDTTIPTSAAVKDYVDTKFSQTDTLAEVLSFGNTTSGKDILVSAGDDITFTDSSKILIGNSADLSIYFDGSNNYIQSTSGTVNHTFTNQWRLIKNGTSEFSIQAIVDAQVDLFYNGTKRFETTNTGASVTGNLVVSGTITGSGGSFLPLAGGTMTGNTLHGDNVKSIYGTGSDLEIFHDGTNSFIKDVGTGNLKIRATNLNLQSEVGADYVNCVSGGAVELYNNNNKKLATASTGVAVTGTLSTTANVTVGANATFVDNGKAIFGAGSDLSIYHNSTNSYLDNDNGDLYIRNNFQDRDIILQSDNGGGGIATYIQIDGSTGKVELSHYGTKRLETVSDGAKVTGNLEVTGSITGSGGSFLPLAGGTMTGNTIHNDNVKSIYGTAGDGLEIFHDGTDSFISDTGTGNLLLRAASNFEIEDSDGINMARFLKDNKVELYYDGSIKLETTNTGIQVNGNAALSTGFSIPDSQFGKFGTGDDIIIGHDSTNSIIRSATGDFFIDQSAVTKSMIFRVSNANALDTTALTINREGDLTTGADVTIAGNLTVNGTTTTINTQTLAVEDPLIELSKDNAANSVDIGFYGKYNDGTARYLGLFSDASDSNKFRLFKGTTVEPTTTVNIAGAGYVAADLVLGNLEATGDITLSAGKINMPNNKAVTWANGSIRGEGNILKLGATTEIQLQKDTTITGQLKISGTNNFTIESNNTAATFNLNSGARGFNFITDNGTLLSIDNNGNSTFAGNVAINGATGITGLNGITFENGCILDDSIGAEYLKFKYNGASAGGLQVFDNQNRIQGYLYANGGATAEFGLLNGAGQFGIRLTEGAGTELFHGTSNVKLTTTSTGVSVTGGTLTNSASSSDTYQGLSTGTNSFIILANSGGNAFAGSTNGSYVIYSGGNASSITGAGASLGLTIDSSQNATFAGNVTFGDSHFIGDDGDDNLLIQSSANENIIIDSADDIILDAGGDDIRFKVGGTEFAKFDNASSNLNIYSSIQDKDIKFLGNDGGSTITALTLDMSNGGSATFRDDIDFGGKLTQTGTGSNTFAGNVEINKASNPTSLRIGNNLADDPFIYFNTDGADFSLGIDRSDSNKFKICKTSSLTGSDVLTIDSAGNSTFEKAVNIAGTLTLDQGSLLNGIINTPASLRINIDSNDNNTGESFIVGHNQTNIDNNNILFKVEESGNATFGGDVTLLEDLFATNQNLKFHAGGTHVMNIDVNGKVYPATHNAFDIGHSTSLAWRDIFSSRTIYGNEATFTGNVTLSSGFVNLPAGAVGTPSLIFAGDDDTGLWHPASNTLAFSTFGGERLRITSAGAFLFNTSSQSLYNSTSDTGISMVSKEFGVANTGTQAYFNRVGSDGLNVVLFNRGVNVGNISTTSSATTFNTSSDYRLKEDLQDFAGLDMVSKIPVYDFKWKTDESRSYGVMAHELQEVLPQAVVGEKDAEEMQSVDYSKIVPLLVKSIQELKKEIEDLKCKCKN